MQLRFKHRTLMLDGPPRLIGIVNITPDSFYDGGVSATPQAAIERALEMEQAGASVIDLGGMTARPGVVLSTDQEAARVVPAVAGLRERSEVVISVDTYRSEVAAAVLDAGADLINDHTGLSDPRLAATVAGHGGGLVVTDLGLAPKQVQGGRYDTSVSEIAEALVRRARQAESAGVDPLAIALDPGLGFGKSTASDLATLRGLPRLLELGRPLLLACSHKEVTAEPLGLPEHALEGTAAVVAVAAHLGVHLLRVHDLPFMAHVARMGWLTAPRSAAYADGGVRSGANAGRNRPPL